MTQRRIYQEEYPYFMTFRTREGWPMFRDEKMAGLLSEIMFNAGRLKRYDILAYQIMPDHVHALAQVMGSEERGRGHPRSEGSRPLFSPPIAGVRARDAANAYQPTISDLMYTVKSYFIKRIRMHHGIQYSVWHSRFYTRIINTNRYLRTVIEYIQRNPAKARLPARYQKSPYQYFNWPAIRQLF